MDINKIPPIIDVDGVLLSSDIITEEFCCDLASCHGACCVEGDAGAPVTLDEVMQIEECLDAVWSSLSASAQAVIDRQGVAYTDRDGDLVTSIVGNKDCVFTFYEDQDEGSAPTMSDGSPVGFTPPVPDGLPVGACCLCALEQACRQGRTRFVKPISCALYPIREKTFSDGSVGLNYHQWEVCEGARRKGRELHLPVYRFLREPLIRRFGQHWYDNLCIAAQLLTRNS